MSYSRSTGAVVFESATSTGAGCFNETISAGTQTGGVIILIGALCPFIVFRLLAFVDPDAESDAAADIAPTLEAPRPSSLPRLFAAWGLQFDPGRVVLDAQGLDDPAIGDDALQRQSRGHVVPDSFTHGTSAQRVRWFRKGIDSGEIAQCDTFKARQL